MKKYFGSKGKRHVYYRIDNIFEYTGKLCLDGKFKSGNFFTSKEIKNKSEELSPVLDKIVDLQL